MQDEVYMKKLYLISLDKLFCNISIVGQQLSVEEKLSICEATGVSFANLYAKIAICLIFCGTTDIEGVAAYVQQLQEEIEENENNPLYVQ